MKILSLGIRRDSYSAFAVPRGRYDAGDVRAVTVVIPRVVVIIVDKVVAAFVIWRQIWLVGYSRRQCQGLLSLLPCRCSLIGAPARRRCPEGLMIPSILLKYPELS